jgi:hypothetical protein
VDRVDVSQARQAHSLDETILQGLEQPLHSPFGLCGVKAWIVAMPR